MSPATWLLELERALAGDEGTDSLATGLVVLATVGGRDVHVDDGRGARCGPAGAPAPQHRRRSRRGLDLHGRAVTSIADDLRTVDRQIALEEGVKQLRIQAEGLAHVSEALHALVDAPDVAWRAYAAGILAQELEGD